MQLRVATWNVLAQAWLGFGDYSHVEPSLLEKTARYERVVQTLMNLPPADIIGLQEVEPELLVHLVEKLSGFYQIVWSKKTDDDPDGCALLLNTGLGLPSVETRSYADGTGCVAQLTVVAGVPLINTHMKWAPADSTDHVGVRQMSRILKWIGGLSRAIILADCNDRAGGPVRALANSAGFVNVYGDTPTARVGLELPALDLLAVRGLNAQPVYTGIKPDNIPSEKCPSDHLPMMAEIEV